MSVFKNTSLSMSGGPGGIYATAIATTAQNFLGGRIPTIGDRVAFDDGRVFRFAKAGGTITIGDLVVATPNAQAIAATYFGVDASTAPITGEGGAIGDTVVRLTADVTGVTKDEYAGGYLVIKDAAGEGQLRRIKSNEATATGGFLVTLYDGLTVALTNASVGVMYANLYDGVVVHTAGDYNGTTTMPCVGIAVVGASSGEYFWVQTWGICSVQAGTPTIKIGADVGPAIDDNGSCQVLECVTTEAQTMSIGFGLANIADTEWGPVFLQICP